MAKKYKTRDELLKENEELRTEIKELKKKKVVVEVEPKKLTILDMNKPI